jgi:hypothetical protein
LGYEECFIIARQTAKGHSHAANASPIGVGDFSRIELPIIRRICRRSAAKLDNGIDRIGAAGGNYRGRQRA